MTAAQKSETHLIQLGTTSWPYTSCLDLIVNDGFESSWCGLIPGEILMKIPSYAFLLTAILICAMLSTPTRSASSPAFVETCYCEAADGSCSATVTCRGGCQKYCGNNDDCWAECSGFYTALATETNLEISYGTYSQLITQLSRISGKDISFTVSRPNQRPDIIANLGFKKAPLWNALEFLSDQGTVRIEGKDFDSLRRLRKSLLSGERINFGIKNTPVNTLVTDLVGLTGLPCHITSGGPMALANVELPQANLDEIITKVSAQTATKIVCSNDAGN
jgi:hypothetical protein